MKKSIIPFFLFASIAILLVGNVLSAQDAVAPAQNQESDKKGVGFKDRLIDFNEIETSNDRFLTIDHWDVELNSSSSYISNIRRSYAKKAVNKNNNRIFLGIRGNFPKIEANSYITVKPRYEISFYQRDSLPITQPNKRGVIPNVGVVREARIRVGGRNYKHKLLVKMLRSTGEALDVDFGSLSFVGWKELVWKNPNFLENYRHTKSVLTPLYPRIVSALKFESIIVWRRNMDTPAGDFITYVDYIDILYNKASMHQEMEEDPDNAIDDEATWNILRNEISGPKGVLLQQRSRTFQCLERMEKMKRNIPLTAEEKNYNPCLGEDPKDKANADGVNMNNVNNNDIAPILDQQQPAPAAPAAAPAEGGNQ